MGERPVKYTLERKDVNGNYEPSNCRWATKKEQSINRRSNRMLTFRGETMTMMEWSRRVGLSPNVVSHRLNKYGWPVDRALSTPLAPRNTRKGIQKSFLSSNQSN